MRHRILTGLFQAFQHAYDILECELELVPVQKRDSIPNHNGRNCSRKLWYGRELDLVPAGFQSFWCRMQAPWLWRFFFAQTASMASKWYSKVSFPALVLAANQALQIQSSNKIRRTVFFLNITCTWFLRDTQYLKHSQQDGRCSQYLCTSIRIYLYLLGVRFACQPVMPSRVQSLDSMNPTTSL